ncbi:MAG: YceI family protein [Bacteriovorax sp.]|nr:YceI family protein [Bacteriovorax sp.]
MVQKTKYFFLSLLFIYSTLSLAQIEKIEIDHNKSSVEFLAIGNPSALKIKGENAKVQGEISSSLNIIGAKLKVDLNEFVTGIDMRDEHMKEEYFETNKAENRYVTLEIINLDIPDSFWKKSEEWKGNFKGKLKLHNVEKDITGDITFSPYKKGDNVITVSRFPIKLTDFKINVPSFVGVTVAEVVNVEVKLPLIVVVK